MKLVKPAVALAAAMLSTASASADPAPPPASTPSSTAIVAGLPPERFDDEWRVGTPRRVDLAAQLGVHRRLDAPPAFTPDAFTQPGGGLDVRVFLSRRLALSLGWERMGLGHETTGVTSIGEAGIGRYADALWLGVRLDPLRLDWLALYVAIGGGAAWQHVRADGVAWPVGQPGQAQSFSCSGSGSVGPGLRADLGLDALLGGGVRFFVTGGIDAFHLGDDVVADCAGGAGSPRMISGRAGLSYSFDVAGDDAPRRAPAPAPAPASAPPPETEPHVH